MSDSPPTTASRAVFVCYAREDAPSAQRIADAANVYLVIGDTAALHRRLEGTPAKLRARLELEPANAKLWCSAALIEALMNDPKNNGPLL